MNSRFDKETSEGLLTFNQDEVFEALAMWCRPKGIILDKNSMNFFDVTSTGDINEDNSLVRGFIVELGFNHRSKDAASTQKSTT
jgi:hypothetical protein